MMRMCLAVISGCLATALAVSGAASAGTRTHVALAGRDDAVPKLGRPGIIVRVEAANASAATVVTGELEHELAHQVHTRRLTAGEPGDYDLWVNLDEPRAEGAGETIRFAATLESSHGERLWRVEGRSDVEGASVDASVFAAVSRNVISALIHDGWLQPRFDPDNPPPQPPTIRNDGQ